MANVSEGILFSGCHSVHLWVIMYSKSVSTISCKPIVGYFTKFTTLVQLGTKILRSNGQIQQGGRRWWQHKAIVLRDVAHPT